MSDVGFHHIIEFILSQTTCVFCQSKLMPVLSLNMGSNEIPLIDDKFSFKTVGGGMTSVNIFNNEVLHLGIDKFSSFLDRYPSSIVIHTLNGGSPRIQLQCNKADCMNYYVTS